MPSTKAKLEFVWAMARNTKATVRQCEALMRYAGTLQRLAEHECNEPWTEADELKRGRIQDKVYLITRELEDAARAEEPQHGDVARRRAICSPVFSNDPRGAVLKIRVPSGWSDSFGGDGICVPA